MTKIINNEEYINRTVKELSEVTDTMFEPVAPEFTVEIDKKNRIINTGITIPHGKAVYIKKEIEK